jgi:5-methylcytosine rRNA methyltransferase NSUN4
VFPKDRALQNFDDFYSTVFGNRWKSIRIALLTEHKYIALVNNFGDTEKTISRLENDGAMCLRRLYEVGQQQLGEDARMVANATHTAVDTKLGQFVRQQESEELAEVYHEDQRLDHSVPDTLDITSGGSHEAQFLTKRTVEDFKKPLARAIEENSNLDAYRMVDGSVGTAGLHEFIPATKIKGMEDWLLESDHYKYYSNKDDFPLTVEVEDELDIPENLHLYTYEKGNVSQFIRPAKSETGVLTHFCMDGGSVLPPLALNIQPGERVLDACAAPGGKSLLMLQTLHPSVLVCNDVQESRVNRINRLMNQYIYDFDTKWRSDRCFVTQNDCRALTEFQMYDKILVDVPCTNDRNSVVENDNNIFKPTRLKERLRLPELQAAMLR